MVDVLNEFRIPHHCIARPNMTVILCRLAPSLGFHICSYRDGSVCLSGFIATDCSIPDGGPQRITEVQEDGVSVGFDLSDGDGVCFSMEQTMDEKEDFAEEQFRQLLLRFLPRFIALYRRFH